MRRIIIGITLALSLQGCMIRAPWRLRDCREPVWSDVSAVCDFTVEEEVNLQQAIDEVGDWNFQKGWWPTFRGKIRDLVVARIEGPCYAAGNHNALGCHDDTSNTIGIVGRTYPERERMILKHELWHLSLSAATGNSDSQHQDASWEENGLGH